jgi:hypothetical protein
VRDPFSLKQLTVGKMLRRESRPLARIQRDFGLGKHLDADCNFGQCGIFWMCDRRYGTIPTPGEFISRIFRVGERNW